MHFSLLSQILKERINENIKVTWHSKKIIFNNMKYYIVIIELCNISKYNNDEILIKLALQLKYI